jgi:hypothetical protein
MAASPAVAQVYTNPSPSAPSSGTPPASGTPPSTTNSPGTTPSTGSGSSPGTLQPVNSGYLGYSAAFWIVVAIIVLAIIIAAAYWYTRGPRRGPT